MPVNIELPFISLFPLSPFRRVKMVTEAAAPVCGLEGRGCYIRARGNHREEMPVFTTKKHVMAMFKST